MQCKNIINLVFICTSMFFGGLSLSLLSPFYPHEALKKGVSVTKSGLVVGAVFITTVLCTPLCGKFIQKLGAKNLLIIGSIICALGNILFGFIGYVEEQTLFFVLSVLTRIFTAVGEAAITATCYPLAAYQVSKQNEGKAMAVAEAFFGVGTMLGASVGGILYDLAGFSIPFYVCGGILLASTLISICCFDDTNVILESGNNTRDVTWVEVLSCPGLFIGLFGLIFAGCARSWYAASLEPFLNKKFGLTSGQCGLVFMAPGLTYTIFTPIFGIFIDRGFHSMKVMIIGNVVILLSFFFMGPIPQLETLGSNLWLTVLSIGVQGLGTAGTFLGALLLMMKGTGLGGLPDTEQVKGMVSSLWLLGVCLGSYIGATIGSAVFDHFSFEESTFFECCLMALNIGVLLAVFISQRVSISLKYENDDRQPILFREETIREEEERICGE
ncbi:MFS-type transporter SLC18B1 isoform X2 [Eurytemora carolleeae]|uniref:MFS-type transporter SLC18B1 isoform X2 n=1 Tax=Eurytemora carolleeae TaxID=1294199 RepID=UPI000C76AAB1|nr:MFS-type transporter SLC18B1 isoform X2 [Eurytemora carolleeae]|eukprot:XP_023339119.1 MFS-type transporter SLC18B1-like isoform X2 [Eurytemora affinis]